MSQSGGGPSDESSLPSAPSEEKQRQIILELIEEEPAPWVAISTLEERLPYQSTRPTIKTRLEELDLQNEVKDRPFNPHAEQPSRLYHLVDEETDWMAPPDAELLTESERRILAELRDDDGDLPDGRYTQRPYEHLLLDTRIGDCFYQGHNLFGDLTLAGVALTVLFYIGYQTASVLPISQASVGLLLLVSILATLAGCFGILTSTVVNTVREATA
jgi:hypothetical protein